MNKIYISIAVLFAALQPVALNAQDLNSGLVAHFPFNGNTTDAGPNSLVATIAGDVTLTSDKDDASDKAYLFNGNAKSYMKIDANNALNMGSSSMSISAWFNTMGSMYSNMSIFNNGSNSTTGITFGLDFDSKNTIGFLVGGGGATAIPDSSIGIMSLEQPANFKTDWHHALAILDRTKNVAQLYLDGVQVPIQKYTKYGMTAGAIKGNDLDITGLPLNLNGYTTSAIGAYVSGSIIINRYDGVLDDLRIYNRVLTSQEIGLLAGKPSGLNKLSENNFGMQLYPNPSNGKFTMDLSNINSLVESIAIIDALGNQVYSSSNVIQAGLNSIDVSSFSKGMYFIKIYSDAKMISKKLLIQ